MDFKENNKDKNESKNIDTVDLNEDYIKSNIEAEETQIVEVVNNEEFLLGRRCSKDIVNFNNEVLIKANGVEILTKTADLEAYNLE